MNDHIALIWTYRKMARWVASSLRFIAISQLGLSHLHGFQIPIYVSMIFHSHIWDVFTDIGLVNLVHRRKGTKKIYVVVI